MADNTSKSNIDDIVSGVQQALKSGELSDGGVKFEFFDEDSEENSFTFEIVEPKEEKSEEKEKVEKLKRNEETMGS